MRHILYKLYDDLLRFTPEDIEYVRKDSNIEKKEDREDAIRILQEWARQQEHFIKKEYSAEYLERCLITSKGSIEVAKQQIDKMCTFRTLMPEYFSSANVMKSEVFRLIQIGQIAVLPTLTKERYRIVMLRLKPNVEIMSDLATLFVHSLVIIAEFLKNLDYQTGSILVIDLHDINMTEMIRKFNVFELARGVPILTEGYGAKVKCVAFITASTFIETFVSLIKPLMSSKIRSRFHVLSSRLDLAKFVDPTEILPKEYGGSEADIDVFTRRILDFAASSEAIEIMEEMNAARTDETKRPKDMFNDQYMGVSGTFRNMTFD